MPSTTTPRRTQEELKRWLTDAKRVVIAGIGNPMCRDDFVGIKIVQDLRENVDENILLIECETVPESFIQRIVDFNPTHLMLIDAAIQGLKQGEWTLIDPKKLAHSPAYSTHALPLRLFCEQLLATTRARIVLLLVEPKETGFGEGLSREIEATAKNIVAILTEALCRRS